MHTKKMKIFTLSVCILSEEYCAYFRHACQLSGENVVHWMMLVHLLSLHLNINVSEPVNLSDSTTSSTKPRQLFSVAAWLHKNPKANSSLFRRNKSTEIY